MGKIVTEDGYGKSLFLYHSFSLSFFFWGVVFTGSLCFPLFLLVSFFGPGSFRRWLREVFVLFFLFVSSFGGGWLREMITGIWWRNLAYFLTGFAVLGVLGFSVFFVARFDVYLVDVLCGALVAEFGVLGG